MQVNTKTVQGRRAVHFASLDEVVAEAERLAAAQHVTMLGNWPLDKLLAHLAVAINRSIDGVTFEAAWYFRLVGPLIKHRIMKRGMPAGFRLQKSTELHFFPDAESVQEALSALRAAVNRQRGESMNSNHPVFGPLVHEEWTQLHLRHSELHLSFARPS